ncbi:uncharacterized protein LOC123258885 [Cotesia glomerata]|uniref:uncharacterized protein LOC123258885 n=1 Tax=Cotesia glomerata TaxID=32391 RepID=UPI001D01DB89|nr:uncharacterized protein LOC123258885 [Cotesia glomerata]
MEIDDEAFLEDLFQNVDLAGNCRNNNRSRNNLDDEIRPENDGLNPNAAEFVPRNGDGDNVQQNDPPRNDGEIPIPNLLGNRQQNLEIEANPEDPNGERIRQAPGDLGNDGGVRGRRDARVMNDDERRQRLAAIIQENEERANRARLAYENLYGRDLDRKARHQREVLVPRQVLRPRDNERQNQVRVYMNQNALDHRRNQNLGYDYDNGRGWPQHRGQNVDNGWQQENYGPNQDAVGPMRNRRGRYQRDRDATYWRSRYYQIRSQNRKVKDFFFHDRN